MSTNNLLVCRVFLFICIVDNCFFCVFEVHLSKCACRFVLRIECIYFFIRQCSNPSQKNHDSFCSPITTKTFILFAKQIKCLLISPTQTNETNVILNINYTNKSIHFINFAIVLLLRGLKLARISFLSIFHMHT